MLIFKKEKQVANLVRQHLETTESCLKSARDALEFYLSGHAEEATLQVKQVSELESQADALKQEVRDVLYSGAFLPGIRADIYRLVDRFDEIADMAEDASEYLHFQQPDIPEEFAADFMELYTISVACLFELNRAIKTFLKPRGKFEKLRERANRVNELESEADAKQAEMTKRVFESGLEAAHKLHLSAFLSLVASIPDRIETACDELVFTALKSSI